RAGDGVTLAERWNGRRWRLERTPHPAGAPESELGDVSCSAASACTAVGYSLNGVAVLTLAERWNGTRWKLQRTPNSTIAGQSFLAGVSCSSARACTAAGQASNREEPSISYTLAERWNGTGWHVQSTPNQTD